MNCPDENMLEMLLDEVIGSAEEAQLRAHLDECAACKKRFMKMGKVDALLKEAGAELPGGDYWGALAQRAGARLTSNPNRAYPNRARGRTASSIFWFLTHAAAVFIIVATMAFFHTLKSSVPNMEKLENSAQTEIVNGRPSDFDQKIGAMREQERKRFEIRSFRVEM